MKRIRWVILGLVVALANGLGAAPVHDFLDSVDAHYHYDVKRKGRRMGFKCELLGLYDPNIDVIHLKKPKLYDNEKEMNHAALHELGHWARADHRLGPIGGNPKMPDFMEELVVDMSAAVIADELGLPHNSPREMKQYIYEQLEGRRLNKHRRELLEKEITATAEYILKQPVKKEKAQDLIAALGLDRSRGHMARRR